MRRVTLRAVRLYHVTIPLSILFAGTGFYLAWANRPAPPPGPTHPVNAEMRTNSEKMARKKASDFKLKDLNGKFYNLAQATEGKPTLIVFIKEGCPCSIEAEPILQQLAKHHGDSVRLVGIINKGAEGAKKWIEDNSSTNLVLCDPDVATMKAYDSPRSVYTTLVRPDGTIEKQWPGWSKGILEEQNELLAKLSGKPFRKFDTSYAPLEDSSGCSFYENDDLGAMKQPK